MYSVFLFIDLLKINIIIIIDMRLGIENNNFKMYQCCNLLLINNM